MCEKVHLHGKLSVEIRSARNIPNFDFVRSWFDWNNKTDAYVQILLDHQELIRTRPVLDTNNPEWNKSYSLDVCHLSRVLQVVVWDDDPNGHFEKIGSIEFLAHDLYNGKPNDDWYDIKSDDGKDVNGQINLRIKFIAPVEPVTKKDEYEVDCYFPTHRNCSVTLYQDAHVNDSMIQFDHVDLTGRPKPCWKELYTALLNAKHLICITGWSVDTNVKLLRGDDNQTDSRSLGEILIEKANNGVGVYVIVWAYARTGQSSNLPGLNGLEKRDQETYDFFLDTQVRCIQSRPGKDKSLKCPFFHHQKTVLCDTSGPESMRTLVAFVGGLDLTTGRWDTPNHELFSTLKEEHEGDFYNGFVSSAKPEEGPRQPWHDVHMKLEGPVAYDIFMNFYERWSYDTEYYGLARQDRKWNLDINFEDLGIVVNLPIMKRPKSKEWNCQVFRSITSHSAKFSHKNCRTLASKEDFKLDNSVAKAYIQMIRNAVNFIYIETQYFVGSSNDWLRNNDADAYNLIPMEIAQKIVTKIKANQHFTAYIVLPIFSEDDPTEKDTSQQEQILWQTRTMEMMYHQIASALKEARLSEASHPTDWLLFLSLGKREAGGEHLESLDSPSDELSTILRQKCRFPIYVHSKMMIVDDTYIIAGSPNINQRSLDGERDTEIAVGCWQPHFLPRYARGDIHHFRMSLWLEHFKKYDPVFENPGSLECLKKVKDLSETNWNMYKGPDGSEALGHMLPYPFEVGRDGSLFML